MNEEGWFSDLYERNYALLYRIGRVFLGGGAREALIEDQIQEAFVRAWQKRDKLQNHPNPDGWMVECFRKCLMNACRKQARDWRRRAFSVEEENAPPIADAARVSPDHYAATREQLALLRRLLGDKDADIFLRCCMYGEKAASIAAELHISEAALRMRVSRLKKKILLHKDLFLCLAIFLLGL